MAQTNQSGLLSAYLVVGIDEQKRIAAVKRLKSYVAPEWADFCIDERSATELTEPQQLLDPLLSVPFGSDLRIVIIHDAKVLKKPLLDALVDYLKDPNPTSVLCLEGDSFDKRTALYKAIAKLDAKAIINCGDLTPYNVDKYITKLAQQKGLNMDLAATKEMAYRLGTDTVAIDNHLNNFIEIYGKDVRITKAFIEKHVAQMSDIKPWDIADALAARDVTKALKLLHDVKADEYVLFEMAITKRIEELICTKSLIARGQTQLLEQELKMNPKIAWKLTKDYQAYARNFTMDELLDLLKACAICDKALKSSPDAETALTELVLKFAR